MGQSFAAIWRQSGLLCLPIAAFFVAALMPSAASATEGTETPAASDIAEPVAGISTDVLSSEDVVLYRKIFAAQEKGRWQTADKHIKKLDDRILMGHVQYQRYLHPTAYRSKYRELRKWMSQYADHPGASRIYRLAVKRRPSGASRPDRPLRRAYRERDTTSVSALTPRRKTRRIRAINRHIKTLNRRGRPTAAYNYLHEKRTSKDLRRNEFDDALSWIAAAYYREGVDEKAVRIAKKIADRNRHEVPLADWTAGLANWRLGNYANSAVHFSHLANSKVVSQGTRAAGAFWAARAYLIEGEPTQVINMLEIAAIDPHSFYGILATRQLGRPLPLNWDEPALDQKSLDALMAYAPVKRAVALAQVGQIHSADQEILRAHGRLPASLDPALVALTTKVELAAAQVQVAEHVKEQDFHLARYPVPNYKPDGGYTVDKALIYALMRQESRFKARAKSRAGARGLMQIMPRTASYVARDRSLARSKRDKLLEPSFNIALGQKYIRQLMDILGPDNNLYMLMVAYNAGPGNLKKWKRKTEYQNDPLLFIESIPARETRGYIEHVLTNFWIYRERFGQDTPSLDAAAANTWPTYVPLDRVEVPVASRN